MNKPTDIEKTKNIDIENNGISIDNADDDGLFIKETGTGNTVYIYYSEVDNTIQQMRKLRFENNKLHSGNSMSSKSNEKTIEGEIQSGFNNLSKLSDYYVSEEWKVKRGLRLKRDAFRCVNCGGTHGLEVHHKGYRGLGGGDDLDDLVTLCGRCHRNVTLLSRKRKRGVYYG